MEKLKEVSVFLPAYNEEKNILNTILKVEETIKKYSEKYEILVIDDGSEDRTKEVTKTLCLTNENIRLITHEENKGYGMALRSGFKNCKYEWITFMDSDGQFDFSEFPNFISTQKETNADLVVGYYLKRKVPFYRKINSKLWQFLIRILLGLKVRDIDCGFKLIRKKVIDSMILKSERGAFISTEFLVKAKEQGFKIVEIPVNHYPRKEGQPTGANLKVILSSFKDLYDLKKKLINFCFVGLTSALVSLIVFNAFLVLGLSFSISVILGILSSIIYNFLLNRTITFDAKSFPIKKQVLRYGFVYAFSQSVNFLVSSFSKFLLGGGTFKSNLAVLIGIVFSIPFSFLGSLLWAFKKQKHLNS